MQNASVLSKPNMMSDKRRHSCSSLWEAETRITQDSWQIGTQTPLLHICHLFSLLSLINFDRSQAGGGHIPGWFGMALVFKSWAVSWVDRAGSETSFLPIPSRLYFFAPLLPTAVFCCHFLRGSPKWDEKVSASCTRGQKITEREAFLLFSDCLSVPNNCIFQSMNCEFVSL